MVRFNRSCTCMTLAHRMSSEALVVSRSGDARLPHGKSPRTAYFLAAALASSALLPPSLAQVPLATYFHSSAPISALDWPAHEWVPDRLAQSFWPALATP